MSGGGGRGSVDCELSEMIDEVEWDERYEWELARSMAPRLLYQEKRQLPETRNFEKKGETLSCTANDLFD